MGDMMPYIRTGLATFSALLLFVALLALFLRDVTQKQHTVLRNFPVIGHFRYWFEQLGEYFRQYFFAGDRDEMPFNRATRGWIYRLAKDEGGVIGFGSTYDLHAPGALIFVNAPFPVLESDRLPTPPLVIGESWCENPFTARSVVNCSGMSFGAISEPAVRALSRGAATAGCWMDTGEGGLSPFHLEGGCDVIMQIGTAKYGVRDAAGNLSEEKLREIAAHPQVRAFEVKLAQGAKPGKGGILPGAKVTPEIAAIRGIPVGEPSISPNRHLDIANIGELGAFVNRVRTVTGKPVGVKFVAGAPGFLDDWFSHCVQHPEGCPDYVQIDGGEGGTGAAPAPLADYVGLPITQALPMVAEARDRHGLHDRIRIIASGKLVTPDKVAWALCMGADFVSSARGFMFALGCIQAMKCGSGSCPTGVTSAEPKLIAGLDPADKAVRVSRYAIRVRDEVEIIAHACGAANAGEFRPEHVTSIERGIGGFRNGAE